MNRVCHSYFTMNYKSWPRKKYTFLTFEWKSFQRFRKFVTFLLICLLKAVTACSEQVSASFLLHRFEGNMCQLIFNNRNIFPQPLHFKALARQKGTRFFHILPLFHHFLHQPLVYLPETISRCMKAQIGTSTYSAGRNTPFSCFN